MSNTIPYGGAYEAAFSRPVPVQSGPAYAGGYDGVSPPQTPPVERAYQPAEVDRGGQPALVVADNPQPPGAATYENGFIVDTTV